MVANKPLALALAGAVAAAAAAVAGGAPALAQEGDPANGEKVFVRCKACHNAEEAKSGVGPHLVGLFGREAGSVEDYTQYSEAMKGADIVWAEDTLDAYLADPRGYVPGNKMAFPGLPKEQDRADVIAYLKEATQPE